MLPPKCVGLTKITHGLMNIGNEQLYFMRQSSLHFN